MKKILFILFILAMLKSSYASDDWNFTDYTLQGSYLILLTLDWQQTVNRKYYNLKEINPIIGEDPSYTKLTTAVFIVGFTNTIIPYFLPKKYRNIWQSLAIGMQITNTKRNYQAGARINF